LPDRGLPGQFEDPVPPDARFTSTKW